MCCRSSGWSRFCTSLPSGDSLAGAELNPDKSQVPAGCRAFLGLSANLAMAACSGVVEFDLNGVLTSGQAAKLRGKFGWAASGTYGRCGRGGQAPILILWRI